ncbi:hypothetical protein P4631_07940 [Halalkalibacterium halodurans]|uniref:hypothetical protein n=1 Tax=Halalkalibacterium halodurans TaxID=86665 RepID=UPI002E1A9E5F|nr:hypothetical protein [Halalkalibacterium halodurans]
MSEKIRKSLTSTSLLKVVVSVVIILVPTMFFGYHDKPTQMSISLATGFLCAVIINLDRFSSFKAGQFEAQIREVEKVINEANLTIEELKEFIKPLLNANVNLIIYDGLIDGMDVKAKEETLLKLFEMNKKQNLNVDDEQFIKAFKMLAGHYFSQLSLSIQDSDFQKEFGKYGTFDTMFENPTVEEVEAFFKSHPQLVSDKVQHKIENYKRFNREVLQKVTKEF